MGSRRELLALLALAACARTLPHAPEDPMPAPPLPPQPSPAIPSRMPRLAARMPVGFVGHGAPLLALDRDKGADLQRWAMRIPRPTAILVVSAHWQNARPALGTTVTRPLLYDFQGFPEPLYHVRYEAPGAPDLARRIESLLQPYGGVAHVETRALDHGVWTPLVHMWPDADVPVLQLSLPWSSFASLLALGQQLAPLRDEGVFLLTSGNVTHNLGLFGRDPTGHTPAWAQEFDLWVAEVMLRHDYDALLEPEHRAPKFRMSHPSDDHYAPLLVAAGAGGDEAVTFPVTGFEFDHLSRRCIQWGS